MIASFALCFFIFLTLQPLLWFLCPFLAGSKGRLLFVLPTSIVEQNLLISVSGIGPDILRWTLSSVRNFSMKITWELVRGSWIWNEVFTYIWQRHNCFR